MVRSEDLWADVARIRMQIGETSLFGSGRLCRRNLVLTARHVLEYENGMPAPNTGWKVRLLGDRVAGEWPGDPLEAKVVWRGKGALDLALLELQEVAYEPKLVPRFAFSTSTMDLDKVWFAGFPRAAREESHIAREYATPARLRKANAGALYRVSVSLENTPGNYEDWSGCSGASVIFTEHDDVFLLGVIQQVPRAFHPGALEVASFQEALTDRDFIELVGSADMQDIAKLPGPYALVGVLVHAASERIIEASKKAPLFGREQDLATLDGALDSSPGVILVQGEAGVGKSTLMAHWGSACSRRLGVKVLYHAFSVREPKTGSRSDMVDNLIRQAAFHFGAEELGSSVGMDHADLLASLLSKNQAQDTRLLVVLDALDEAAERIDSWTVQLGCGVCVVATCRAKSEHAPEILQAWRDDCLENQRLLIELNLLPLDGAAIAHWVSDTARDGRTYAQSDALVIRALAASEGIPLFAKFLIPDIIQESRAGSNEAFPADFMAYAKRHLRNLRNAFAKRTERDSWSWGKILDLFGLLTISRAPLPSRWIHQFFEARLDQLDSRIDRWLWRRDEGVSFAHSRFASIFQLVLRDHEFDVAISELEDCLIQHCEAALLNPSSAPLRTYALLHLPTHLVNRVDLEHAKHLLSSADFLFSRLEAAPTAVTIRNTYAETLALSHDSSNADGEFRNWLRLWSEMEGPLVEAICFAQRLELSAFDVLLQLIVDRFGDLLLDNRFTSQRIPRLERPSGLHHPLLKRTLHQDHDHAVKSVIVHGQRLVSCGSDGAIRIWDAAGNALPGGVEKAHDGQAVLGVLAFDAGYLSWSYSTMHLWDWAGNRLSDAERGFASHHSMNGVLMFGECFVSWGQDGTIFFWDTFGNRLPGGDQNAHKTGKYGLLVCGDRLVSWGEDNAIRFWDRQGNPLPGGDYDTHPSGVTGMLALDNSFISWGSLGGLRFWDWSGNPLPYDTYPDHGFFGVLPLDDCLMSWAFEYIEFWDRQGNRLDGHAFHKGVYGMLALDDCLVSWGSLGDIRFWDNKGNALPGGDGYAHADIISGMLVVCDQLVSWSKDGAIRLWDIPRDSIPDCHFDGHDFGMLGMLDFGGILYTWGYTGDVRFWDEEGNRLSTTSDVGRLQDVAGMLIYRDRLVSWSSAGVITFSDEEGTRLAVMQHPGGIQRLSAWNSIFSDGGVLAFGDFLISWGERNAVCFWNKDGYLVAIYEGMPYGSGISRMAALGKHLVAFLSDGTKLFWDEYANQLPTDTDHCIPMQNPSVGLSFGDHVVQLVDGNICFKDAQGHVLHTASRTEREIRHLLTMSDRIVGWGPEIIRLFDAAGDPLGMPWFALGTRIECVKVVDNEVWVGILGQPKRVLFG